MFVLDIQAHGQGEAAAEVGLGDLGPVGGVALVAGRPEGVGGGSRAGYDFSAINNIGTPSFAIPEFTRIIYGQSWEAGSVFPSPSG